MPSSSFYADGETYDTAVVTSNDIPASTTPSQAPSSFYPSGTTYNEVDEAAAASSASQAAASAAAALASQLAVQTNATNAASSAAGASASASAAAASKTAADTDAANALASQNAAATSDTNAASSATAAASSASSASTSASTATTKASAASTSASNAATSETNAASSATAANTSATNAATSATNAASAVQAAAGTATPQAPGTAAVGTGTKWAHEDHVHPFPWTLGQLPGTTGTTQPGAGKVGERISATTSPTLTASGTPVSGGSITLTPGVWDIEHLVVSGGTGATSTSDITVGVSTVSASLLTGVVGPVLHYRAPSAADIAHSFSLPRTRVAISANTTYYSNMQATFTGASYGGSGVLQGTRVS